MVQRHRDRELSAGSNNRTSWKSTHLHRQGGDRASAMVMTASARSQNSCGLFSAFRHFFACQQANKPLQDDKLTSLSIL
jgi:hypothetical protein